MEEYDDLPSEFDVVVIGTGLLECVVAAAVSRAGKTVLHLDENSYYGAEWATLSLDSLLDVCRSASKSLEIPCEPLVAPEGVTAMPFKSFNSIREAAVEWYQIPRLTEEADNVKEDEGNAPVEAENIEVQTEITESMDSNKSEDCPIFVKDREVPPGPLSKEDVLQLSRKFNIDLVPKVAYSRGPLVKTLLRSGVSRYMEFVSVQTMALVGDNIEQVPATKSEVFASKAVTPLEKRALMSNISGLADVIKEEGETIEMDELFSDRLLKARLPSRLVPLVSAMAGGEPKTFSAAHWLREFLAGAGVFARSPILWPMFGSGELLQAFSRLAAVYGGIYCLGRGAESLAVDDSGITAGIFTQGRFIRCRHAVVPICKAPNLVIDPVLTRVILLADKPLTSHKREAILHFSLNPAEKPVRILQLSHHTSACPSPYYLFHLTGSDANAVRQCVDTFFSRGKPLETDEKIQTVSPALLEWITSSTQVPEGGLAEKPNVQCIIWLSVIHSWTSDVPEVPEGLHLCHGPDADLDFKGVISEAEKIFKRISSEEEFLPPVPDVEESVDCAETDGGVTSAEVTSGEDTNSRTGDFPMMDGKEGSTCEEKGIQDTEEKEEASGGNEEDKENKQK